MTVYSKTQTINISGSLNYVSQVDSDGMRQGYGKTLSYTGNISQAVYKDNHSFDGKVWKVNDEGTFDLYEVKQGQYKLIQKGVRLELIWNEQTYYFSFYFYILII